MSREFYVVVEKDEDGFYVADVPALQGCHTQGRTFEEAIENIREVIACVLKRCERPGKRFVPITRR
jgi:predicted RNase H-like HicB family nuclease